MDGSKNDPNRARPGRFRAGGTPGEKRLTPYYMAWLPQRLNDDVTFVWDLFELGGSRPVEE